MRNVFIALLVLAGLAGAQPYLCLATNDAGPTGNEALYVYNVSSWSSPTLVWSKTDLAGGTDYRGVGCNDTESGVFYALRYQSSGTVVDRWSFSGIVTTTTLASGYPFGWGFAARDETFQPDYDFITARPDAGSGNPQVMDEFKSDGTHLHLLSDDAVDSEIRGLSAGEDQYLYILWPTAGTTFWEIRKYNLGTNTSILWAQFESPQVPVGRAQVWDCGYNQVDGRVYFAVETSSNTSYNQYPVQYVEQGHQTNDECHPIMSITRSSLGGRQLVGLDFSQVVVGIGDSQTSPIPDQTLSVSENPFSTSTVITSQITGTISIYDLSGRVVVEAPFSNSYVLDAQTLVPGVYMAVVVSGNQRMSTNLVRL